MKFATIVLAALLANTQAIKIRDEEADAAKPAPAAKDPEDAWIEIPKFTDSTKDKVSPPEEQWGHETQRVGHEDWLDQHVKAVQSYREHVDIIQPAKPAENRVAIPDSF